MQCMAITKYKKPRCLEEVALNHIPIHQVALLEITKKNCSSHI